MDDFRYRWNDYKFSSRKFDRKESCMQKRFYRHFSSPGDMGFLSDVSATLIDKTGRLLDEDLKNHGTLWLKYWR